MGHDRVRRLARSDRGQTLQDFVLGIGIFIVAFMFVLSLFPGLLTPFQSTAGGSERAQAEQVSTRILSNMSAGPQPNHLDGTRVNSIIAPSTTQSDLRKRFGLASTTQLNVTVESLNGTEKLYRTSNSARNHEVATSARIVTLEDARCRPACRLVVRVW